MIQTHDVEEWRPVPVAECSSDYEVSNLGRIRRKTPKKGRPSGLIIKVFPNRSGHLLVKLWAEGKQQTKLVHRMVLIAFNGDPPEGMECCHNDGDKNNNRLDNLRWDTRKNNHADKIKHGTTNRGERQGQSKLTTEQVLRIRELGKAGMKPPQIARIFPCSRENIRDIIARKRWEWLEETA